MKKGISILIIMCTFLCTLLTGCGKSTVNLNDYVEVEDSGYNGYGSVYARLDFDKILEDFKDRLTDKNLDSSIFGDKTPMLAAMFIISEQKPFRLAYESGNEFSNGDEVEFTWNTNSNAIEALKQVLNVEFKYKKFTHKVKGLKDPVEVDPFENIRYHGAYGMSGCSSLGYLESVIKNPEGDGEFTLNLKYDESKNGTFSNGDTLTLSVAEEDKEKYVRQGIILTRTSADVTLDVFSYYPINTPGEIFTYLSDEDKQTVIDLVKRKYQKYKGDINVEYVGAMWLYDDEIDCKSQDGRALSNNKLVLIMHATNGLKPGGWYTYMATGPVCTEVSFDDNGEKSKLTRWDYYGRHMSENFSNISDYYETERFAYSKTDPSLYFEYGGLYYEGHETIKECIDHYINENIGKKTYDHLAASDSIKQYVTEH